MPRKPLKILISAYACGPNWGSEIGMGWNWVMNLSEFCQLTVITESEFKEGIEQILPSLNLKNIPQFCYIDIGERGRKLFWKQGSFLFYRYYERWQLKAYHLAQELFKAHQFDLIHQLNMIGYREPGYLWKISDIPYIIGPVGGYEQFPFSYMPLLSFRDKCFYFMRSVVNIIQQHLLERPKKAYKHAKFVIAATNKGALIINKYSLSTPLVIPETGAMNPVSTVTKKRDDVSVLNVVWCGILKGSKGLPIALKAINNTTNKKAIHVHIVGDGPNMEKSKRLADTLDIRNITWYGRISNERSKQIIKNADVLFFTSLLEATSTVIFEALESQTPVLCHDSCGFGSVIDEQCGIKIPMINQTQSVLRFSYALDEIIENPLRLEKLKTGCSVRINDFLWTAKAKKLTEIYTKCCRR